MVIRSGVSHVQTWIYSGIVLGSPVDCPLEDSIVMFPGLVIDTSFVKREGSLVRVSLVRIGGLMIGTGGGSLAVLSLVLTIVYPIEYPNTGDSLPGTLLGSPVGL